MTSRPMPFTLEDMLQSRRVPNAGLYLAVTQKCPMSCQHCSTNSSVRSPFVPDEEALVAFIASTAWTPPKFVLLTGGEPLTRPRLVQRLARIARQNGSAVYLITGGFWTHRPSQPILDALPDLDILCFSYDRFHAREVSRADLFAGMRLAEAMGLSLAVQTVVDPEAPEFTRELLDAIGQAFDGRVPVYTSGLSYHGRANQLGSHARGVAFDAPCLVSTWPVVSYTGAIVACCQLRVVDNPTPPDHLLLGRLGSSSWQDVSEQNSARLALRAVRALGPGAFGARCGNYCDPCLSYGGGDDRQLEESFRLENGELRARLLRTPGLFPTVDVTRPGSHA